MFEMVWKEVAEEFGIAGGLTLVQFLFAIYGVVYKYLMSMGFTPLFLIVHVSFASSMVVLPFAVIFERSKWPKRVSGKLLAQVFLISFGGTTMFQGLMLIGIEKTSPAVASAMPNLAPGLIFIIACTLRFEKLRLKCTFSRVKILGTLVCIAGAIMMSFLHSSPVKTTSPRTKQLVVPTINNDKIIGTMCLMSAIIILSFTSVLTAATLVDFPAPLSLCAMSGFVGVILTGIVQLYQVGSVEIGSPLASATKVAGFSLLGGVMNGVCNSFQTWVMKCRGPVFVSTFSPIGTVFTVILSAYMLRETVTVGSLCGMSLMFVGLYFVLWAKKKEDFLVAVVEGETPKDIDVEKPLLT